MTSERTPPNSGLSFFKSQLRKLLRKFFFERFGFHTCVLFATARFNLLTSQLPKVIRGMVCLVHLDFVSCFGPQCCAFLKHSAPELNSFVMFCPFWLRNLFRSPGGARFLNSPTSTSECASRLNGVQFFISHPTRWLRTHRFSRPTFRPSGARKHSVSRLCYPFAHLHLLSSDSFYSFASLL